MKEHTPKFDAAVNALRKKHGQYAVKVQEGITRRVAVMRHTQGEHTALAVRLVSGKERITRNEVPAGMKIIPFHN